MQQDTVVGEKLVHNPKFIGALFLGCFAAFYFIDLTETAFGRLLAPVIGEPKESGAYGRFVVSFTLAFLFCLNLVLIGFLKFRVQVIVVWLELTTLFMGFFYLFDLSLPFIQSKLWFLISQGVFTTLYVSAISIALAFIIAIFGAIAKLSPNGFAFAIASFYTSFFRGLPLLMLVYLIYLGMPQMGYVVNAVPAGIAALSLCYGAYMTEIFRAGIESISRGQWEGARALGFRFSPTMRMIILPQAVPLIIPPTGNQFIAIAQRLFFGVGYRRVGADVFGEKTWR